MGGSFQLGIIGLVNIMNRGEVTGIIRLTFVNRVTRMEFYGARTKPTRDDAILIRDDLTKEMAFLAYKCREEIRAQRIHRTWTFKGKVFVQKTENTTPRTINTFQS